jgi:hypothetical protein
MEFYFILVDFSSRTTRRHPTVAVVLWAAVLFLVVMSPFYFLFISTHFACNFGVCLSVVKMTWHTHKPTAVAASFMGRVFARSHL